MPPIKTTDLLQTITNLAEQVEKLSLKFDEFTKPKERTVFESVPETIEEKYPIPSEYREIVNTVLNNKFGVEVTPLSDRPAFQFTVIVPREYSNALPEHFNLYGADKRPKVISFAEGVVGVREWCEKVLNNLSQDAKAKIMIDKVENKA